MEALAKGFPFPPQGPRVRTALSFVFKLNHIHSCLISTAIPLLKPYVLFLGKARGGPGTITLKYQTLIYNPLFTINEEKHLFLIC